MSISSVVITGTNRGLGLEFVKQFVNLSKAPKHIFALCRNPVNADELQDIAKSNSNVCILKADMKDFGSFPSIVQSIEEKVGEDGLNLLINNAGIAIRDTLETLDHDHLMENFEINTVSPLLFTKECLPLLKKAAAKTGGNDLSCLRAAVVNITSKMGSIDDNTSGGAYPYRISKVALNMATKSLAVDLKPHGILAFVLHPGWVLTDMGGENALIDTKTSISSMLNVMLEATADQDGLMLNYNGKPIPW